MYKLTIYIYSNHVPFDARQKSYEFKSLINFGTSQKKFKIPLGRTILGKLSEKRRIPVRRFTFSMIFRKSS